MRPMTMAIVFCTFNLMVATEKGTTLTKIECVANEQLCSNHSCKLSPISQLVTNITVGCWFPKPLPRMMVRLINLVQIKSNKYRKNLFDQTFDYCEFSRGASNLVVKTFAPHLSEMLSDIYRPCPLSGEFAAKNITIDGSKSLTVGKPVGYRFDIILMTKQRSNILKMMLYGEVINN